MRKKNANPLTFCFQLPISLFFLLFVLGCAQIEIPLEHGTAKARAITTGSVQMSMVASDDGVTSATVTKDFPDNRNVFWLLAELAAIGIGIFMMGGG